MPRASRSAPSLIAGMSPDSLPWLSVAGKLKQWICRRAGQAPGVFSRNSKLAPRSGEHSSSGWACRQAAESGHAKAGSGARRSELRPRGEIDPEAGAEDDEVGVVAALRRGDDDVIARLLQVEQRAAEVEMRMGMLRDAQGARPRGRRLCPQGMVEEAPFPLVGQAREAVDDALAADAGELVDARHVGTADEEVEPRATGLQCVRRIVHR